MIFRILHEVGHHGPIDLIGPKDPLMRKLSDDLPNLRNGSLVDCTLGQLAHAPAKNLHRHEDDHEPNSDRGDLIPMVIAKGQSDETDEHRHRAKSIAAMMPGIGIKGGTMCLQGDATRHPVEDFFGDDTRNGHANS